MNFKDITHAVKNIYESGGVKKFYKGGLIAIVTDVLSRLEVAQPSRYI